MLLSSKKTIVFLLNIQCLVGISLCHVIGPESGHRLSNTGHHQRFARHSGNDYPDVQDVDEHDIPENHTLLERSLHKRGSISIAYPRGRESDSVDLQHEYNDFLTLIARIYSNWNTIPDATFNVYFHPADKDRVKAVLDTLIGMAQPGGLGAHLAPNLQPFKPWDFSQIVLKRTHGYPLFPILAQSFNFVPNPARTEQQTIKIYDFGWQVLYHRFLNQYTCRDIGPKVNYKFQFLGGLILHEVLHFRNVVQIAWNEYALPL